MEFKYNARTQDGKEQVGVVKARSEASAIAALQEKGLFITSLKAAESESIWNKPIFGQPVRVKEIATFARQAAVLLKSGTPIVGALRSLAQQGVNPHFKTIILEAADKVREGSNLSKALAGYPKVFSPFFLNVIKSGEASGRLSDSLSYLADHLKREYELKSKIKGAMIYPSFVLGVFVLVFILMMVIVIPNLQKSLVQFNRKLPWITQFILDVAHFFSSWSGIIFVILLLMGTFLAFRWRKTPQGKSFYDRLALKLPFRLGKLLQKYYATRFSENLAVLINAGLPISEALKITANVVGNTVYRKALQRAQKRVIRGEEISVALQDRPDLFHPLLIQMIQVGEKTGTLGDSLQKVVEFYQGDINRSVDALSTIIEPILILVLGVLVGGLVIGIFLPIVSVEIGAIHM